MSRYKTVTDVSSHTPRLCRLTFQVTDVLRLRIRACAARPATAKCGGKKPHKGACADCGFAEPSRLPAAYSYRLLNDVCGA